MDEENIFSSKYPDLEFPKGNFISHLFKNIRNYESLTALVCGTTFKETSYKELEEQTYKWCGYFSSKFAKGSRIAFVSPNCPEYCISLLGAIAAGMLTVGIYVDSKVDEIYSRLKICNVDHAVYHESIAEKMEEAMRRSGKTFTKILIGQKTPSMSAKGIVTFEEILAEESIQSVPPVEVDENHPLCIVFTSGSTGRAKPLEISHKALTANLMIMMEPQWNSEKEATGEYQPVFYLSRVITHLYGMLLIFFCGLCRGNKLIVKKYDSDALLDTLEKFKVSTLHIVPAMMKILLRIPSERPSIMNHLKAVISGGAPIPPSLEKEFRTKFGRVVFQRSYGMSELLSTAVDPVGCTVPGSTGVILNNLKIKILHPVTKKSLSFNEPGEIVVKSPSVFTEYIGNPEATAATKTPDGWCFTGDIGMIDEETNITLVDRIKEIIKTGFSLLVYPAEIESVLMQHPGVAMVCVVGVPHADLMEVPRAYIVRQNSSVTEEELKELVADKMSEENQLLGGVVFLDDMPRTPLGKVARSEIKKMAQPSNSK